MTGIDPREGPTRFRYLVLGFVAFAAANAYLTRHGLAVANTTIQEELGFNNEDFGWLYGAFSLGYLICQVPGGWLGQRFGTRKTITGLSALWSICTVVTAAAASLWVMILSRFVFGLAQAGLFPNTAKVIKDWLPVSSRGKAGSYITMAMSLGGIITVWLTSILLKNHGWREILVAYSLVGIVWAAAFWLVFRTRPSEHAGVNQAELQLIRAGDEEEGDGNDDGAGAVAMDWGAALRSASVWALCLQMIFKAAGYNFYVTFFPAFLEFKYEIAKSEAGMLTAWPLIGVVTGALFGGAMVDSLFKKTGSRWISRSGVAAGSLGLTAILVYASTHTSSAGQLVSVIAVGAFLSGFAMPCPWAASIDLGGRNAALVMGLMNSTGCLAGILISPMIGRLIDDIKETGGNWDTAVVIHAGFYLLAAVLWLAVNPNRPLSAKQERG